jgi:hypothetical protein
MAILSLLGLYLLLVDLGLVVERGLVLLLLLLVLLLGMHLIDVFCLG